MRLVRVGALVLLAGWLAVAPRVGAGHDPQPANVHAQGAPGAQRVPERVRLSIPDIPVVNQDGQKLRFYSDLVKGKVVAINFIYTTCTTVCPVQGATFARMQDLMGERTGVQAFLIAISVDPVTDTPERLKAWGAKFHAQPGWTSVTGKKADIDKLLRALGAYSPGKEDHPPMLLIGNDARGSWTRAYGLAPPARLVALVDDMIRARETDASTDEVRGK